MSCPARPRPIPIRTPIRAQKSMLILLSCALVGVTATGCGFFERNTVLILARRGDSKSLAIADCYAERRGIPTERILEISLTVAPNAHTIDATRFKKEIAGALDRHLRLEDSDGDITTLITTRGFPLFVEECAEDGKNCEVAALDTALAQLGRTSNGRAFESRANPFFRSPGSFEDLHDQDEASPLRFLVGRLTSELASDESAGECPRRLASALDREPPSEDDPTPPLWWIATDTPRAERTAAAGILLDPIEERMTRYGHRVCDGCRPMPTHRAAGVILASPDAETASRLAYPGIVLSLSPTAAGDASAAKSRASMAKGFRRFVDRWLARGATAMSIHLDDPNLAKVLRPTAQLEAWARGSTALEAHWKAVPTLGANILFVGDPSTTLASTEQAEALEDDRDGDGIPNHDDNCPEEPNVDQRDTNEDGFGNLCDADVDDDGIVDSSGGTIYPLDDRGDLEAITLTARNGPYQPDHDLNGDGRVDEQDLAIARLALFRPPGR